MADTHKGRNDEVGEGEALLAFSRSTIAMVLTDPHRDDNPIVFVNRAFERMTGYEADAAIGRNCRFLQGPRTDPADVDALRKAVAQGEEISIDLVNYRAGGDTFLNRLTIAPIRDDEGELRYFVGIQKELHEIDHERRRPTADRSAVELQHRVKNHLAMIVSLVRMQARSVKESQPFTTVARRIESLQLLYEEMSRPDMGGRSRISLGTYLERVVSAVSHLDPRPGIRVEIASGTVFVDTETALRLGLLLSELLTNCLQHAFPEREDGRVEVRLTRRDEGGLRLEVTDDGVGMPEGVDWPNPHSLGGRIVLGIVDGLDGEMDVQHTERGTVVRLDVPVTVMELKQ